MEKPQVSLWTIFFTFARIGVVVFGGGYAMLPILRRELVENRKWTTDEQLSDYFAIGQCTPGVIAVNTSTFIGANLRGIWGGIVATLGFIFPSLVIILLIAGLLSQFAENIYVQKAFLGIRICITVLIIKTVIQMWKSTIQGKLTLIIFLVAVACSVFLDVSPVIIVLVDVAVGILVEVFLHKETAS